MALIDKATEHYKAAIAGDLRVVYVPEWDETIYFRPSMTLQQNAKLLQLNEQGKSAEALVEAFIVHARDADGNRLCKPSERTQWMRAVDQGILARVVNEMLGAEPEGLDEKN